MTVGGGTMSENVGSEGSVDGAGCQPGEGKAGLGALDLVPSAAVSDLGLGTGWQGKVWLGGWSG